MDQKIRGFRFRQPAATIRAQKIRGFRFMRPATIRFQKLNDRTGPNSASEFKVLKTQTPKTTNSRH